MGNLKIAKIRKVQPKVIVLEDLDFTWEKNVVDEVIDLWGKDKSLTYISSKVKRKTEETFLLLMDLSIKGLIDQRKNYIWGTSN